MTWITKDVIAGWFEEGVRKGATHMINKSDDYSHEYYPVYVMPDEDVYKVAAEGDRTMEVYSLRKEMWSQLNEDRAFHYD